MKITTTKTETVEQDIDLSIPVCLKYDKIFYRFEQIGEEKKSTYFETVNGFTIYIRNYFSESDVKILLGQDEKYEPITEEEFNQTLKEKLLVYGIIESINDVQNVNIG